jgi:4,5-DOPA dioxygenase extradiol
MHAESGRDRADKEAGKILPAVFVSHGAPTLPLTDAPAAAFLRGLGARLGRPRAILAVSAHWETERPTVNAVAVNATIHDFHGFPPALYDIGYPAPGSPKLAERVADLLCLAGLGSETDTARGLDHGAWVPLLLMYPAGNIPVVQLSVQSHLGPAHHLQLGWALAPLRAEGVLVLASGSLTHDLSRFRGRGLNAPEEADATEFASWFERALIGGRTGDLLTYRSLAPHAVRQHPTEEHLLPLFVALGAAGMQARAEHLHASATFGVLRMDAYAFS